MPAAAGSKAAAGGEKNRRYDQLMGDSEPDVTDRKFVQELQRRLEIKYYESQAAKERQLAEAERKRVRRLALEGGAAGGCEQRRRTRPTDRAVAEWTEFWPPNPDKSLEEYEAEKRRAEEEKLQNAAAEEKRYEDEWHDEDEEHQEEEEEGHRQQQQQAQRRQQETWGKYSRVESARVRALQEEQDLAELYRKASELVYVAAAPKSKRK